MADRNKKSMKELFVELILTKENPLIICTDQEMVRNSDVHIGDMLDAYHQNPLKMIFTEVVQAFQFELFLIVISLDDIAVNQILEEAGCVKNPQIRQRCQLSSEYNFYEKDKLKVLQMTSSEIDTMKPLLEAL